MSSLSCCRMAEAKPLRSFGTNSWEPKSQKRIFILGMGFVGHFFAQQLKTQGWDVSGTCTSITKKKKLEDKGFDVYHFDANDQPEWSILDVMNCHTHLLVSIPPLVGIGDPMLLHEQLLKNGLVDGNLQWLCYLSSTSVYGNCGGKWVDEEYPPSPTNELARLRLAAEKRWLELGHNLGIKAHVFRLGGIYGPGRSAVDTIIKQHALSEQQRKRTNRLYTSRVHVEDVCQALKASTSASVHGKVFNIVDDDPAPREEVFAYARDLIEKKWSGQIKWSPEQEEVLVTVKKEGLFAEKRVSNARMKKELRVRLLHASYRSGLQSIIDQMENPFQHSSR